MKGVPLMPTARTIGADTYPSVTYLAGLLGTHTGNSLHDMRSFKDFIGTLDSHHVGPQDVMSLLTRIPIKQTMNVTTFER